VPLSLQHIILHHPWLVSTMPRQSPRRSSSSQYTFNGVSYDSYQAMVHAKRQRNQQRLVDSGLLEAVEEFKTTISTPKKGLVAAKRKRIVTPLTTTTEKRVSKRLAGQQADGKYIDSERAGKFTIGQEDDSKLIVQAGQVTIEKEPQVYDKEMTLAQAVETIGSKWLDDDSVSNAQVLCRSLTTTVKPTQHFTESTAKVVPDRIYGICAHPSRLLVAAGDKKGFVGLWNVDDDDDDPMIHLFRYHQGAAACLAWSSPTTLVSSSYDGSVRVWDAVAEQVRQTFDLYDYTDNHSRNWLQYSLVDPRNSEHGVFVSTSLGEVLHVDWRAKQHVTMQVDWSDKKINTLRYDVQSIYMHDESVSNTLFAQSPSERSFHDLRWIGYDGPTLRYSQTQEMFGPTFVQEVRQ